MENSSNTTINPIIQSNIKNNSTTKIAVASFIGSSIEFYDFYIYGLAAALFLGPLFFPSNTPGLESMAAFLTFGIAFIARPIGSVLFGHFGDKIGRRNSLVASLLIMGICTTTIGLLPTYEMAGIVGSILLCIMRFGQGIGLGGEWGGAAILATESAPKNRRGLFAMFPQIGPPIGFILATGVFIILHNNLTNEQMYSFGWRIPFLVSIVLVILGLYVRITLVESPIFIKLEQQKGKTKIPLFDIFSTHFKTLFLCSIASASCFILFFITTVFSLQYETAPHPWLEQAYFSKNSYLFMMMIAMLFMVLGSVFAAYLTDKYGRRTTLIFGAILTIILSLFLGLAFNSGNFWYASIFLMSSLFIMGIVFMPLAAFLPETFPSNVRYTGASLSFSLGGILGGSLTPFFATWLTNTYGESGIYYVSLYLICGAIVSMIAILMLRETKTINYED